MSYILWIEILTFNFWWPGCIFKFLIWDSVNILVCEHILWWNNWAWKHVFFFRDKFIFFKNIPFSPVSVLGCLQITTLQAGGQKWQLAKSDCICSTWHHYFQEAITKMQLWCFASGLFQTETKSRSQSSFKMEKMKVKSWK